MYAGLISFRRRPRYGKKIKDKNNRLDGKRNVQTKNERPFSGGQRQ